MMGKQTRSEVLLCRLGSHENIDMRHSLPNMGRDNI